MDSAAIQFQSQLEHLPADAQREAIDFIAFLHNRYGTTFSAKKKLKKNHPFVGLWKGRREMADSRAWVKEIRIREWH